MHGLAGIFGIDEQDIVGRLDGPRDLAGIIGRRGDIARSDPTRDPRLLKIRAKLVGQLLVLDRVLMKTFPMAQAPIFS